MAMSVLSLEFQDNHPLTMLATPPFSCLDILQKRLNIRIFQRGNIVTLEGETHLCQMAAGCLQQLYDSARTGMAIPDKQIDALLTGLNPQNTVRSYPPSNDMPNAQNGTSHTMLNHESHKTRHTIGVGNQTLHANNAAQMRYIQAICDHLLVIGTGPAGTGKTHIAVGLAVKLFLEGQVERIILARPAVEAGERLGSLPGDIREKIDPYFQPVYDSLYHFLGQQKTERMIAAKHIEIAPLAYMRGRTLKHAFILLDEAQNSTVGQMKMFLTRLGEKSHMVINGDLSQIDLPENQHSGLSDAILRLKHINNIAICDFSIHDAVRHPLVREILNAYANDKKCDKL